MNIVILRKCNLKIRSSRIRPWIISLTFEKLSSTSATDKASITNDIVMLWEGRILLNFH